MSTSENKGRRLEAKFTIEDSKLEAEAIQHMMQTRSGRFFLWKLLSDSGVFHNAFDPDPGLMAFNCGMQNQGQKLLATLMKVGPTYLQILMEENANVRDARNKQRSAISRLDSPEFDFDGDGDPDSAIGSYGE